MKPKFNNWYKFIWWMLAYGNLLLVLGVIFSWYCNATHIEYIFKWMCLIHIVFWCIITGVTIIFEEIWNRFC